MRIAFIITRSDVVGGAQIHVRDLSTALRDAGHDTMVIAGANGPLADDLKARGIPFYPLHHLVRPVGPLEDARCLLELSQPRRSK